MNQKNYLKMWAILFTAAFLIISIIFIFLIDLAIFRYRMILAPWDLRLLLLFFAFIIVFQYITKINEYFAKQLNNQYLKRFNFLEDTKSYIEARERVKSGSKKYSHAVLLLHGFARSPQQFQFLTELLDKSDIFYYAPHITGFGSDNTHILSKTTRYDWYRHSLNCFDLLAGVADEVSIVGHSLGSILASYISGKRSVNQLILTGPGLYCFPTNLKYKKLLTIRLLSDLYIKLVPYLPKPIFPGRTTVCDMLDNIQAEKSFQYVAIPLNNLRELAYIQDEFSPLYLKSTKLSLLYGAHELTVDIKKLFEVMNTYKIQHTSFCFKNSGHNVLEDFDKVDCCQTIVNILKYGNAKKID